MSGFVGHLGNNLSGAWAIMRGQPEGLSRLDLSLDGFWRSFGAIVLLAPFAMLALLSQRRLAAAAGEATVATSSAGLGLEAIGLLLDWLAFPLVFALLARPLGLSGRYVAFIVARNWGAVLISAMVAVVHAAHLTGLLPSQFAPSLLFIAVGFALRFSYVITRTALGVPFGVALPIVALDFLLSLTIWASIDRFA